MVVFTLSDSLFQKRLPATKGQTASAPSRDSSSSSRTPSRPTNTPTASSSSLDKTPASSSSLDNEEFRLKGELFDRAARLSTGKRRHGLDRANEPTEFLPLGQPRKQLSAGWNSRCRKTDSDDCEDPGVGWSGQGSDQCGSDFSHLDSRSHEADALCVGDEVKARPARRAFGGEPTPGNSEANTKHLRCGDSQPVLEDAPESSAAQKGCGDDTAVRKQTRTPMLRNDQTALRVLNTRNTKSTIAKAADEHVESVETCQKRERTRTAKSLRSRRSISDIVDSGDAGNGEPSASSVFTFRSEDDDDDFGDRLAIDETEQPACERQKGAGKEGRNVKVTGKRKAETITRPRKRKKLEQEAEESVVSISVYGLYCHRLYCSKL